MASAGTGGGGDAVNGGAGGKTGGDWRSHSHDVIVKMALRPDHGRWAARARWDDGKRTSLAHFQL